MLTYATELLYEILYQFPSSPIILTAFPSYKLPKTSELVFGALRTLNEDPPKSYTYPVSLIVSSPPAPLPLLLSLLFPLTKI